MRTLSFREQMKTAADYLISRRHPVDGGWGLNIEKGFQASSIVNTAESLFVINRARCAVGDLDKSVQYLKDGIRGHPSSRGDNLRYLTFGLWGLLEAGLKPTDPFIIGLAKQIEGRVIGDLGWSELGSDDDARIWPTFQSLWMLTRVFGRDYVTTKYYSCLKNLLNAGRSNLHRWGFSESESPSLAATSYVLILLSELYPGSPEILQTREGVLNMLSLSLTNNQPVEVEAVAGTDWHHYSYSWALKAIHSADAPLDQPTFSITLRTLTYVKSLFRDGRGYSEPGKPVCNVRSNFNCVLAVDAVIESFDPSNYSYLEQLLHEATLLENNSVFLSFSYQPKDIELVGGFREVLETTGYTVITGEKNPMGSLSKNILKKIRQSEKFVVVMTCRDKKENGKFTTSSWLLEEKGAALALGKACLMLVEDGIDDKEIGGLQGDDQRLYFRRENFTKVVADALRMLR